MPKQEKTATTKQPKTVQVKLLVPYAIILVMFVSLASLVTGWQMRSAFYSEIKSQVSQQVAETVSLKEVK